MHACKAELKDPEVHACKAELKDLEMHACKAKVKDSELHASKAKLSDMVDNRAAVPHFGAHFAEMRRMAAFDRAHLFTYVWH
eukprot:1161096-Pelagomonas_calceolata.AAC.8